MTTTPFQTTASAPTGGPFSQPVANPATDRQVSFLRSLLQDRDWDADVLASRAPMVGEFMVPGLGLEGQITKSLASAAIDYLVSCPWKPRAPKAEVQETTTPEVEDGSYALEFDGQVRFFHVRSPKTGRWEGYTFVDEKAGPEEYPVRNAGRRERILAAIAADPEALARYGQELGVCGMCHRELTDEVSRAAGLGPVCRNK